MVSSQFKVLCEQLSKFFNLPGFTVIANGKFVGQKELTFQNLFSYGQTDKNWQKRALDWAEKAATTKKYSYFDVKKVATGGQSCGGSEAAWMAQDPRVGTVGIFNSGAFPASQMLSVPGLADNGMFNTPNGSTFKIPAFFFLGGPTDVAYENVRCRL